MSEEDKKKKLEKMNLLKKKREAAKITEVSDLTQQDDIVVSIADSN